MDLPTRDAAGRFRGGRRAAQGPRRPCRRVGRQVRYCFRARRVGGICFAELARLGVGRLYGVDIDQYGEDSWQTQPMRRIEDADAYKAVVQARIASEANPACTVTTAIGFAQDMPLHLLCRADVLVVAGDNLELAVWAGNIGAALGVPVLVGAVEGHTWLAACRGFDLTDPEAACPGCTLSDGEWKTLTSRAGCDPHTLRAIRASSRRGPSRASAAPPQ